MNDCNHKPQSIEDGEASIADTLYFFVLPAGKKKQEVLPLRRSMASLLFLGRTDALIHQTRSGA